MDRRYVDCATNIPTPLGPRSQKIEKCQRLRPERFDYRRSNFALYTIYAKSSALRHEKSLIIRKILIHGYFFLQIVRTTGAIRVESAWTVLGEGGESPKILARWTVVCAEGEGKKRGLRDLINFGEASLEGEDESRGVNVHSAHDVHLNC